jgi:hypothetical protein
VESSEDFRRGRVRFTSTHQEPDQSALDNGTQRELPGIRSPPGSPVVVLMVGQYERDERIRVE